MSRIRRTVDWIRREGVGKALEEKELRPIDLRRQLRSRTWALRHGHAGGAGLIVIAGVQRSGTNMLLRALRAAPELQVVDEGDRRAFREFRLVDDATVQQLVEGSRHQAVVLKPLCDAHRTPELLDLLPMGRTTAIWAWRGVDGTSRSSVARFDRHALDVVAEIASSTAPRCWQAEGLSEATIDVVRSMGRTVTDPLEAAALLWWARNRVALDRGLDRDPRVLAVRYESLRATPAIELGRACAHVGVCVRPNLHAEFDAGRSWAAPVDLRPALRERCDVLTEELDAWTARRAVRT